jgi:pimeloyl-ACP methyl ester carboxylesterase
MVGVTLAAVRAAAVPYLVVAGDDLEPDCRESLTEMLPQAADTVWQGSGHCPHIAQPGRFAACLAASGAGGSNAAIIASAMKAP